MNVDVYERTERRVDQKLTQEEVVSIGFRETIIGFVIKDKVEPLRTGTASRRPSGRS
jgi:hypothetical protein